MRIIDGGGVAEISDKGREREGIRKEEDAGGTRASSDVYSDMMCFHEETRYGRRLKKTKVKKKVKTISPATTATTA